MVKRCQLRGHAGPVVGQVISLSEREFTLGRDLASDIVIADSEVSRTHARISSQNEDHWVQDLKSTNGTWINGRPITGLARLTLGDMLTLGKTSVFVYELIPESDLDTSREPGDGDLIESTMAMPAFPEAALEARRLVRPPAEPVAAVQPAPAPAGQEASGATGASRLRSFYQKYLAYLQAGNIEDLLSLYHPDATVLSVDRGATGTAGIAQFFAQYFGGLSGLRATPTGKCVEGPDSIVCETDLETSDTVARVQDMFALRDGKATHHFTCAVESGPKRG